jgi:hypothetical protein
MRRRVVEIAALALVLAGVALASGQAPRPNPPAAYPPAAKPRGEAPPAKSKLEEMLAQALKDNPDIRVAAAKLAGAEAELNRVRLQVAQKVLAFHSARDLARSDLTAAEAALARMQRLGSAVSRAELDAAQAAVVNAKAKLAAVEAEAPYLVGKQPQSGGEGKRADAEGAYRDALRQYRSTLESQPQQLYTLRLWLDNAVVKGPMADKIRKALDRPVSVKVTDASLESVLRLLKSSPEIRFHLVHGPSMPRKVTMDLQDVSLGAALEWLEDSQPGYRIVVREYGILITPQDRIPPEAVFLHDFWKGKHAAQDKPEPAGAAGANPPPEQVEGVIKSVDGEELVKVSIGSDAGLAKGHTLEVFRLKPKPMYVGTLRILEVTATEAVGRPVGRMRTSPREGDNVISAIRGR